MMTARTAIAAALLACALAAHAQVRVPLTELGTGAYYGYAGGLYEGGSNLMPPDHFAAGLAAAAQVRPLDSDGRPAASGRVAMVSIGMSNTTQEFCAAGNPAPCTPWSFVGQALADPAVNKTTLVFVNGARGGEPAETWDAPNDRNYDRVRDQNLRPAGLSEAQVQVAWVKVANPGPTIALPSENADAWRLVAQIGNIVRAMKTRYPNLRIVYLSSRTYAGYATTALNPEPYAYESGFAVKWVIQAQIDQMRARRIVQSRAGDLDHRTVAPWIAWGPYLWDPTWTRADFAVDGTHPSQSGQQKVGKALLEFLKNEPTAKPWFLDVQPRPKRRAVRS